MSIDWEKFRRGRGRLAVLNDYQSELLRAYVRQLEKENEQARGFGWEEVHIGHLQNVPCEVEGMVAVVGDSGGVERFLPPRPGSFPHDPRYQPPPPIDGRLCKRIHVIWLRRDFVRCNSAAAKDQWNDMIAMDAPDRMPGGSVVAFSDEDPDVFGGWQSEVTRES